MDDGSNSADEESFYNEHTSENEITRKLSNKQRIIRLQELLKRYTDEVNQLTLDQIIDKFYEKNRIHVGKKAIRDDLKELEDSLLFDVTVNQVEGIENYYSHQYRLFEIHELRLLIDAVSAAKFISISDTENLVSKIQKLTSENLAKQLENRILLSEYAKNEDDKITKTYHELHMAISNSNMINFQYGKYNLSKKFQLNRNADFYSVKPFSLVWSNDFYYLIGEYVPSGDIRHYRVDRMRKVSSTQDTFVANPRFNVTKYTEKLFYMYSGDEALIEIEFDHHLINVVIDRFGRGVHIRPAGEKYFRVSTQAIISDGLVRWLLTWGSDAKVLTPPSLVERMREEAIKIYHTYY